MIGTAFVKLLTTLFHAVGTVFHFSGCRRKKCPVYDFTWSKKMEANLTLNFHQPCRELAVKLQQQIQKLNSMSGTIRLSLHKPESLARSLHTTSQAAQQLAAIARGMRSDVSIKKILIKVVVCLMIEFHYSNQRDLSSASHKVISLSGGMSTQTIFGPEHLVPKVHISSSNNVHIVVSDLLTR